MGIWFPSGARLTRKLRRMKDELRNKQSESFRALQDRDEDGGEFVSFLAKRFKLRGGNDAGGDE
jgi:hypothetical protein